MGVVLSGGAGWSESDPKWSVWILPLREWRALPCHSRERGNPCWRLDSRFRGSDIVVPVTRDFRFQIKHLFRAGHFGSFGSVLDRGLGIEPCFLGGGQGLLDRAVLDL